MSQKKDERPEQEGQEPFVPASPVKRTLAWIGLVYAFMLLGMTTYIFFTGTALGNLGPALALPGLVGLGAVAIVSRRTTGRPGAAATVLVTLLSWGLAIFTAPLAWVGFLSNFGG